MIAIILIVPKVRDRLQSILNSKARKLGKASFAYREHVKSIRKWLESFSTNIWIENREGTRLETNSRIETTLIGLTSSIIDENPVSRPTASMILDRFSREYDCCRRGRDEFEPDWFGANRALRDQVLQEVEGSVQ